jgi:hypothetical protein
VTQDSAPRTCRRCILDATIPGVDFDSDGLCNYCRRYDEVSRNPDYVEPTRSKALARLVDRMKQAGRGRDYDCVIGLSGGIDSSYAAYVAKRRLGLRPLAVHVDNGWNSELAVKNIENIVRKLDIDLSTHVIDWEEFRQLQLSLFRAHVVDIELVTDHAIIAAMYHHARQHRVGFIVSGDNHVTEATLPPGWNHRKTDLTTLGMLFHQRVLRIEYVGLLSYVDYVKADAIEELERELGWRPYGGKHYESIFTRFYQGYILPRKFGIDKRRFHYARLICSGQMTREEAVAALREDPYDAKLVASDRRFVLKKLRLSEAEFERYMEAGPRSHYDYPTDEKVVQLALRANRRVRDALGSLRAHV